MRLRRTTLVLALLAACGKPAELTPPIQAPLPAAQGDREAPPRDRLPADTRPEAYALTLSLDPASTTYRGSVTIDVTLDRPRESIWLHNRGPRILAASVERSAAQPLTGTVEQVGASGLSALRLAQPVGPGRVRLRFDFEAEYGTHLTGLYRAESGGAPYLFTQFEPISAREAFPCFDEPRFKTPFDVTVQLPKQLTAIANTRPLEERELDAGRREVRFARTEKLPTYLIALAVGPFDVVPGPSLPPDTLRTREVPLRGVAVRDRGGDLSYVLRETGPLVTWLERYFGVAYPYDKLDLIAVPDFGAGAMENAGAITFRDTLLLVREDAPEQQKRSLAYVNAHELAHQWFGNLVTMPWWDDIWLNEAFATWMGMHAVSGVHPEYEPELGALSATHGAMELDSRRAARKIRQPIESDHDIESAFDAITYSKGGAVLSMFERYLGAETFRRGLSAYMERYRFGSATARDLVQTLGEVSGQAALESAFFSFLDQPGVPQLQVQLDCKTPKPALELEQKRYLPLGSTADPSGLWQLPVCVRFAESAGKGSPVKEQCVLMSEAKLRMELESSSCPSWLMPNAGAQGYYRWALADQALDALVQKRSALTTAELMSLSNNIGAALRAGRIEPKRALAAQKVLAGSPQRHVVESALKTYWLVYELLDDASLPAFRAEVASTLRPAYQKLGLAPRAGASASGEEKLLRASIVRALYALAEEPNVTRELARLGAPLLAAGASQPDQKLPSELIELALSAAVRAGGVAAFDRAVEQLFAANDGLVRGRMLTALSSVRDPVLGERALALALDARLRTNEKLLPLYGQSGMKETRGRAFAWLKTNVDALMKQLGAHGGNDLISTVGGFCSEQSALEVEQFFGPKSQQIPGGPRELALSLENIRSCAALLEAHGAALRALYTEKR